METLQNYLAVCFPKNIINCLLVILKLCQKTSQHVDSVFGSVFQGDEKEPQYFVNYCQLARENSLKEVEVDKEVEEEVVVDEAMVEVETVGTQIIMGKEIDLTNNRIF